MQIFVTGGSGFIGRSLIKQLIARGDTVVALVRSEPSAAIVLALGATPIFGDLDKIDALEAGMQQVDVVFHLAAHYAMDGFGAAADDVRRMEQANIIGTHNVLRVAHALNVPKIVVTSSIAIFGDTGGLLICEEALSQPTFAQRTAFLSAYEQTKWRAYVDVIQAFLQRGAPIVTVLPSVVYGLDGGGIVATLLKAVRAKLPLVVGSDTQISLTHVDDVAMGHLLAAERGRVGESYILAGDVMTVGALVKLVSGIGGQPVPHLIESKTVEPLVALGKSVGVEPEILNLLGVSYLGSAEKARRELGWTSRPLFEGLTELVHKIGAPTKKKTYLPIANSTALLAAGGMVLAWRLLRREDSNQ